MTDVDDIIYYIKSLKKGFDKDLFQSKIDELSNAVDTNGLIYEDFHTLFKVWLNLSIPITKWVSLGSCLVPLGTVEEKTVEYALRWLLVNQDNLSNHSRVGIVLDWLSAAMECEAIDMVALDNGYEIFYTMMTLEITAPHALKLVYNLTKQADVSRWRVRELLEHAKIREGKKNMSRTLHVLLGLFKSYKPECVPENIPAVSIHAVFKKLNISLLARFKRNQELRNRISKEKHRLQWVTPLNSDSRKTKKADPLVPSIQFHDDPRQRAGREPIKNLLDFTDPVSLMQYSLHHTLSRPARLRALLCNATGLTLLTVLDHPLQVFLLHDLHHLLHSCFLDVSPHSYLEKQDLLQRLADVQRTATQGVPVITAFLAQYLLFWNERDYFYEILSLMEWVSVFCPTHIQSIATSMSKVYLRAPPLEQCAILRTLTTMYTNLVYSSTKTRYHFSNTVPSENSYLIVLHEVAAQLTQLCNKSLQVNPEDLRVAYSALRSAERCARAELCYGRGIGALPEPLTFALPLLGVSAELIDQVAQLMIMYKTIVSANKAASEKYMLTLNGYMSDIVNCLYSDEAFSGRANGIIFNRLPSKFVDKLVCLIPDADAKFSLRNHLAYAYTYTYMQSTHEGDANNWMWFNKIFDDRFPNLRRVLKQSLRELR